MDDRLREIAARLQALEAAVADLSGRIDALDRPNRPLTAAPAETIPARALPIEQPATRPFDILSLIGRTLIVLGGAVLLRALTDSGQVAVGSGIAFGLLYAVAWYVAADRAGRAGRRSSAVAHGIAAVTIGLPLVWEAATRFDLLGPVPAAVVLGLLAASALVVAGRHDLTALGAVSSLGAAVTALGLAAAMDAWMPFAVCCTLLWLALWIAGERRPPERWLRWAPAAVSLLLLLGLTARVVAADPRESVGGAAFAHLVFIVAAGTVSSWRALVGRQAVGAFEVSVTVAALTVSVLGTLHATAGRSQAIFLSAAIACLLAGSAAYGLALAFVRRRQGQRVNYMFYTSIALTLVVIGVWALLDDGPLGVTAATLALAATVFGWRATLPTLTLHGAVLALVATTTSGWPAAARIWIGDLDPLPAIAPAAWFSLAVAAGCLLTPRPATWDPPAALASAGRGLLATLVVTCVCTALAIDVSPVALDTPATAGALASWKTSVLAVAAVAASLATRHARVAELGWLVYPLLFVGGAKLLLEDFRISEPATLFAALAVYGVALVLAPRLRRGTFRSAAS